MTEARKAYIKAWRNNNKDKVTAASLKWRNNNRSKWNNYSKKYKKDIYDFIKKLKDNPCTDCGNKFQPCAMDFDHTRDKSFSLNSARSIESLLKEIAKCELVCANCHRVRTMNRNKNKAEFNT